MFNKIQQAAKSDAQLSRLLDEAGEYASVYVLARHRQKGCDGMGELATMEEELKDVVSKVMQYCKEKEYISGAVPWDIDSVTKELTKL